jgi:hypothetical protein
MLSEPDDCAGCIGVAFSGWSPTAGNSGIFLPPAPPAATPGPLSYNGNLADEPTHPPSVEIDTMIKIIGKDWYSGLTGSGSRRQVEAGREDACGDTQ